MDFCALAEILLTKKKEICHPKPPVKDDEVSTFVMLSLLDEYKKQNEELRKQNVLLKAENIKLRYDYNERCLLFDMAVDRSQLLEIQLEKVAVKKEEMKEWAELRIHEANQEANSLAIQLKEVSLKKEEQKEWAELRIHEAIHDLQDISTQLEKAERYKNRMSADRHRSSLELRRAIELQKTAEEKENSIRKEVERLSIVLKKTEQEKKKIEEEMKTMKQEMMMEDHAKDALNLSHSIYSDQAEIFEKIRHLEDANTDLEILLFNKKIIVDAQNKKIESLQQKLNEAEKKGNGVDKLQEKLKSAEEKNSDIQKILQQIYSIN